MADEPALTPPPPIKRRIWLEIAVVLLALYCPLLLQSALAFFDPGLLSFASPTRLAFGIVSKLGQCVLLVFLMSRSGFALLDFGIRRPVLRDIGRALVTLVLIFFVASWGEFAIAPLSGLPGAQTKYASVMGFGTTSLTVYMVVGVAYEEIFMRSYLCTRLRQLDYGPLFTVALSSVLFAMPHVYQGWLSIIGIIPIGAVLGWAFLRFRSIVPVYLAHLSYDLLLSYMFYSHRQT